MIDRIKATLIIRSILSFLGTAPDALKGHLNVNELVRIVVTTGLATGSAYEVFKALAGSIDTWVAPGDVGLVTAVCVLVIEVWRRLRQGDKVIDVAAFPHPDDYDKSIGG